MNKNIFNQYKSLLGEYCAVNQFVELSKRAFLHEHDNLDNPCIFKQTAINYSLTLSEYNISVVNQKVSLNYIVSVHLCFELFLHDMIGLIKDFGVVPVISTREKDESWLNYVLRVLFSGSIPNDIEGLVELCEYYRLIRNCAGHSIEVSKEAERQHRKLFKYVFETNSKFSKLSAPNVFPEIQFDDFIMFARSSQLLAGVMYKNIRYDYEKVLAATDTKIFSVFSKDINRMKNAIYNYVITCYSDDGSLKEKLDELAQKVMARWSNG